MPFFTSKRTTDLGAWVEAEFRRLSEILNRGSDLIKLHPTYVAPVKSEQGDIRYADGTNWNPGHGAGPYIYNGQGWINLGPQDKVITPSSGSLVLTGKVPTVS